MALVPEDGTGVSTANTYATAAEVTTFAGLRGVTVPANVASIEVLLVKAMDFIEANPQVVRYQGFRTHSDQPLSWPRSDVYVDNLLVDANAIPWELKHAQIQLAIEAQNHDLQPTKGSGEGGAIVKEKIDVIETVYDNDNPATFTPAFAKAEAHLAKLFRRSGLTAVRS